MTVEDDGQGVPQEALDRIFERFTRADALRSRRNGGAGLGLSIVAAIARAHGGACRVADAPGGGAIFEPRLPLSRQPAAGIAANNAVQLASASPAPRA